jgi:hypothetical protein
MVKVSMERVAAFVKRFAIVASYQEPNTAIAILAFIVSLIQVNLNISLLNTYRNIHGCNN